MTTDKYRQIAESLQDKEYRDLFFQEEINTGIPLQIYAMRTARGWTPELLAERANIDVETVTRLEEMDGEPIALDILEKLASAFDVALVVRFEPFGRLVKWSANLTSSDMAVPSFDDDMVVNAALATSQLNGTITIDFQDVSSASPLVVGCEQDSKRLFKVNVVRQKPQLWFEVLSAPPAQV